MKFNKRIFKIVTILISTLLLGLVVSRMSISDKVILKTGEIVKGKIAEIDPQGNVRFHGDTPPIDHDAIALDSKGKPDVERGIWIVIEQAGNLSGLKWLLLALFLFSLPPFAGAIRWRILMRTQGIDLPLGRCQSLSYIGYLFNYITPGLTGGDFVKAYYVSRETHRKTEAVLSVFMDRIIGLVALTALGLVMVLTRLGDPQFSRVVLPMEVFTVLGIFGTLMMLSRTLRRRMPQTFVAVMALGGIAIVVSRMIMKGFDAVRWEVLVFAVVALVAAAVVLSPARKLLQWERIKEKLASINIIREVDSSFTVYRKHPWTLLGVFFMSSAIHVLNVVGVYACARALGVERPLTTYLVLLPVILMVSSIPISVAGLGVQESMFPFFFGMRFADIGANEAAMIAFMFRFGSSFIWVVPGYIFLLLWRGRPTVSKIGEDSDDDSPLPAQAP